MKILPRLAVIPLACALSHAAPVILNEFNAVGNSQTLPGDSSDVRFDQVNGNGGDWFELVVTGTGRGSTVDMRGWKIQAARSSQSPFVADDTLVLSSHSFWSAVPAGTILTFTESRTAEGGLDTSLNATDRTTTEGWSHSNIWIGDPTLITYTDPATNGYEIDPTLGVNGFNLNELDTQFQILNNSDLLIFGPVGEGIEPAENEIADEEIFALQQSPSDQITPTSDYGDTSKDGDQSVYSTFGEPNQWSVGSEIYRQSFAAFQPGAVPPVILSSQKNLSLVIGDPFSYSLTAIDAAGESLVLILTQAPSFLSLTDNGNGTGTLSGQPAAGDAGTEIIKITARDASGNEHLQAFVLTILPANTPLIVNEYNAVAGTEVLSQDWSFDQRFGLVRGNGDDWIELVVVGNGTPGSTIDMRQWKIVVEEDTVAAGTIVLSNHSYWQNVQAGTILTFTESDSTKGGWDTQILAENRFANEGWGWSNIHLADSIYLNPSAGTTGLGIGGDDTRITILDETDRVMAGPFGEGIFSDRTVNNTEVFRLATNPATNITPLNPNFTDSRASTFGHPNRLPEADGNTPGIPAGTATGYQSFLAFATGTGNAPPYFTNLWGSPDTNNTLPGQAWTGPTLTASDPDHSNTTLTYSLVNLPAGASLTNLGDGTATWSWTPTTTQIGTHALTVRVSDPGGASLTRTITLTVMPPTSPVIINEYNAVSSSRFLNGGTALADDSGGTANDPFLGRIQGNGGDWFELVVVGNGTANSTTDLRGWIIEISENYDPTPETIVLSQDPYWSNVRAGTILTFVDRDLTNGGLDSGIHRINRFSDLGYAWTNVAIHDHSLVDQTASNFGSSITLTSSDTEITLKDSSGTLRHGPTGEPRILRNINSGEVFHLEANPVPGITASVAETNFPYYADNAETSSLGAPNSWDGGANLQDFTPFLSNADTNSQPVFTLLPTDFYGLEGTPTTQPIQASDHDGAATITFPNTASPAWVTITDNGNGNGTLTWSPPAGTNGFHTVSIQVSDGTSTVTRSFEIFIHRAQSPVLLNEYNAVSSSNFLNGGSLGLDNSGGQAADTRLGRHAGNGGDWFELAVVGDNQPGTLDLRGWRIEISEKSSFPFSPDATIELSQDPFWANVPHGTLLTFTEETSATGGWDTDLNADHQPASGWSWSNIWIGDPQYLTYTDSHTNGFRLDPATGRISNFDITSVRTQFLIRDASGTIVHGPAGEDIGLTGGISSRTVWQLVGDPVNTLNPHLVGDLTTGQPGATPNAKTSTFGQPNTWNSGSQNFTTFLSAYTQYITAAGLSGNDALTSADPDGDGYPNGLEFALGSQAQSSSSLPQTSITTQNHHLVFLRRSGGTQNGTSYQADQFQLIVETSPDLQTWTESSAQSLPPDNLPPTPAGYEYTSFAPPSGLVGEARLFFRIRVTYP